MVREECVHTRDTGCPLIALLREGSCSSVHEAIPRPRSLLSPLLSVFRSLSLSLSPPSCVFSPLFAYLVPSFSRTRPLRATFSFFPPSPPPPRHPPEVVAGPLLSSLFLSLSRFRSHFLLSSSFSFYFFFGRIRSLLVITRKAGRGAREKRERGWRRGREKEREPVKVCIIRIYICIYIYT